MAFFQTLKDIFSKKYIQEKEVVLCIKNENSSPSAVSSREPLKRKLYQSIPRTQETQHYIQSMVMKAYSPDSKVKPSLGNVDPQEIEHITNKLKEEYTRKK